LYSLQLPISLFTLLAQLHFLYTPAELLAMASVHVCRQSFICVTSVCFHAEVQSRSSVTEWVMVIERPRKAKRISWKRESPESPRVKPISVHQAIFGLLMDSTGTDWTHLTSSRGRSVPCLKKLHETFRTKFTFWSFSHV